PLARLYDGAGRRQGPDAACAPAPAVLQPVLACAGYHLGRCVDRGLPDGSGLMDGADLLYERTPGVADQETTANVLSDTTGFGIGVVLTIGSFIVSQTDLLWAPGIPPGLMVLAFAQIGVHLVFFLQIGTGPDNTNNVLALVFGLFIAFLVIGGSCFIIANLN